MKISYAITVCNELEEIQKLIPHLLKHKREEDEIVVQQDELTNPSIENVQVQSYINELMFLGKIKFVSFPLNNDFASFKNNLTKNCKGNYVFQIDADEIPNPYLLETLPTLLEENPEIEVLLVPRKNYVMGITPEHVHGWGWKMGEDYAINWPDLQWRIYKNTPEIKWVNKVHERLDGFKVYTHLPLEEEYSLNHTKTIEKQTKQNQFYSTI